MHFTDLRNLIRTESLKNDFAQSTENVQREIFTIKKEELIPIITEIGSIPEDIGHDSSEEKLYAKAADIVLAKCFQELGFNSSVTKERANCADVFAKSRFHRYSLVGDAKAFRLSRTAKNQKDFKVKSMVDWKGDNEYAVLACPYFQYPKSNSQIYGQALDGNVTLFSWEYLSILLENDIAESETVNISNLWNISAILADKTKVSEKNKCFLEAQNNILHSFMKLTEAEYLTYFSSFKKKIIDRGQIEIKYWEAKIDEIKHYTREQAIRELLTSSKLNEKIASIKRFINSLKE